MGDPPLHIHSLPDELLLLASAGRALEFRGESMPRSTELRARRLQLPTHTPPRVPLCVQVFAQLAKVPPVTDEQDAALYTRTLPFRTCVCAHSGRRPAARDGWLPACVVRGAPLHSLARG